MFYRVFLRADGAVDGDAFAMSAIVFQDVFERGLYWFVLASAARVFGALGCGRAFSKARWCSQSCKRRLPGMGSAMVELYVRVVDFLPRGFA